MYIGVLKVSVQWRQTFGAVSAVKGADNTTASTLWGTALARNLKGTQDGEDDRNQTMEHMGLGSWSALRDRTSRASDHCTGSPTKSKLRHGQRQ